MIEELASSLGRHDEAPNIFLAEKICADKVNREGKIKSLVGLLHESQAAANDAIKVLYEIGNREPELIAAHVEEFLTNLTSKNNRLVWGCMTALSEIAHLVPDAIYNRIESIKWAYETGSVITRDNSITVFASLCRANPEYENDLFPFILEHLKNCRSKEVAQHAERASICVDQTNLMIFREALENRISSLSNTQLARVKKLIKRLEIIKK